MMERREWWTDDLIEAVSDAMEDNAYHDEMTYAVIAAVEDWQDRTQQARAMSMTDNEAAIARVREVCDQADEDGTALVWLADVRRALYGTEDGDGNE